MRRNSSCPASGRVSLRGGANHNGAMIGGTCGVGAPQQTDNVPSMLTLTTEAQGVNHLIQDHQNRWEVNTYHQGTSEFCANSILTKVFPAASISRLAHYNIPSAEYNGPS